jgi:hypothetical protein
MIDHDARTRAGDEATYLKLNNRPTVFVSKFWGALHFSGMTLDLLNLSRSKIAVTVDYIASSYSTSLSVEVTSATPSASSTTWSSHSSSVSQRSRSSRIARPPRRGRERIA